MGFFKKLKKKRKKTKEEKIMSNPTLKKLHAKAKKSAEKSHKSAEEMLKTMGIDSPKKKKLP